MSIIKVQNLTKTYSGVYAVDHISFSVERGTMLGFLGVNGAGKSTTIHMLSTLLKPDAGDAKLCGFTVGREDYEIRRRIGIVYQQNCLDDLLTVKENLICASVLHGASKEKAVRQLKHLCEILKLENILRKRYRTLSGGQKRRCEIAAALMHTPEILFLDEPTTGLDPATRQDVWAAITDLQQKEKITVFLTTHYMEEAARADNIIIMNEGKITASGAAFELKEKYTTDKLRLYYKENAEAVLSGKLEKIAIHRKVTKQKEGVEIALRDTLEAIPILQAVKDEVDGFEVIQGNMDDVFLHAVGDAAAFRKE